jgi:hypothetical protein
VFDILINDLFEVFSVRSGKLIKIQTDIKMKAATSQNSADTVLLSTDGQLYLPTTNLTVAQINFFDKDSKPSDLRIKLATGNMIVAEDGNLYSYAKITGWGWLYPGIPLVDRKTRPQLLKIPGTPTKIIAGPTFAIVIADGVAMGWGENTHGALAGKRFIF